MIFLRWFGRLSWILIDETEGQDSKGEGKGKADGFYLGLWEGSQPVEPHADHGSSSQARGQHQALTTHRHPQKYRKLLQEDLSSKHSPPQTTSYQSPSPKLSKQLKQKWFTTFALQYSDFLHSLRYEIILSSIVNMGIQIWVWLWRLSGSWNFHFISISL